MKKTLSFVLMLLILVTTYAPSLITAIAQSDFLAYVSHSEENSQTDGEDPSLQTKNPTATITRAEWLQSLVTTFGYSIEEGVVIDNYYTDLDPTADYYKDVMTAVYYGLVDILPNEPFYPDKEATREFVAHTLNKCMGYLLDEGDGPVTDDPFAEECNLVAGKPYKISEQYRMGGADVDWGYDPSAPVSYPDSGKELTDGIFPAEPTYSNTAWMALNNNTPAQNERGYGYIIFDLGAVCNLNELKLTTMKQTSAGINCPYVVEAYVSNDGTNYAPAGSYTITPEDLDALADDSTHAITVDLDTSAQYVQMRVTSHNWCFMGEVEIMGTVTGDKNWKNTMGKDGNGDYICEVPYGYTWFINYINGTIVGEDTTICTTQDAYNACNPNWAITVYLEKQADGTYVALQDAIVCPGSAAGAGITLGENQIALVAHSAYSNPNGTNWQGKVVAMAVKAGDTFEVDLNSQTVTAIDPAAHIDGENPKGDGEQEEDADGKYTFIESDTVTYPNDIQIAINRGWFTLADGAFMPEQAVTVAEQTVMLEDAKAYVASFQIDPGYDNQYVFYEDVIVLNDYAEVTAGEEVTQIVIENCSKTIAEGDKFVIYQQGLAIPYRAVSVATYEGITTITATEVDFEQAIKTMDVESSMEALPNNFYTAEDTQLTFIKEGTTEEYTAEAATRAILSGTWTKFIPKFTRKIDLGNGLKIDLSAELKNTAIGIDANLGWTFADCSVWLDTDVEVTAKISGNLIGSKRDGFEVYLGGYEIPGVGGLEINFKIDAICSISVVKKFRLQAGMTLHYDLQELTLEQNRIFLLQDKGSSINAQLSAKIYIEAKFGVFGKALPTEGYVYAEVGLEAKVKSTTYIDPPGVCTHFAAYLYAELGAKIKWKIGKDKNILSWKFEIIKEENSPLKLSAHYEDGKHVPSCTRKGQEGTSTGSAGKIGDSGYTTKSNSSYSGSGWTGGGSSTGYNENGDPIPVYSFSLDENGGATITNYTGNAVSLTLPQYLDGHPVVAIGANAFQNNTTIKTIMFQDNILTIDTYAFYGCKNLRNVTLSNNLRSIGSHAFERCSSLTTIYIPDSVTEIHDFAFAYCPSLQSIELSDNLTYLGENVFVGCYQEDAPEDLFEYSIYDDEVCIERYIGSNTLCIIPSEIEGYPVVELCGGSFMYTDVQYVILPSSVKEIGWRAFEGSAVNYISLAEGLQRISDAAFLLCSLKTITIPESVQYVGDSAFAITDIETINCKAEQQPSDWDSGWWDSCFAEIYFGDEQVAEKGRDGDYLYYYRDGVMSIIGYKGSETDVTFPTEIKGHPVSIVGGGRSMFSDFRYIKNLVIPEGVIEIYSPSWWYKDPAGDLSNPIFFSNGAFVGCALESVVLPESLQRIGSLAFLDCENLVSINLPSHLKFIGDYAFSYCDSLKSISIPASVTYMGEFVFADCRALETIYCAVKETPNRWSFYWDSESVISMISAEIVWGDACPHNGNTIDAVLLSPSFFEEGIGAELCDTCGVEFERKTLPACGEWRLENGEITITGWNGSVANLVIPAAYNGYPVTKIENYAFWGSSLQTVTIPSSVQQMGYFVFDSCELLERIYCEAESQPAEWDSSWNGACYADVYFAGKKVIDYEKTEDFVYQIDNGAIIISRYIGSAENVVIPSEIEGLPVIKLGNGAFGMCSKIKTVTIPSSVQATESFVFYDCDALTDIYCEAESQPSGWSEYWISPTVFANIYFDGKFAYGRGNYEDCIYKIENERIIIIDYLGNSAIVEIPSEIRGYPVVAIDDSAFYDCDVLTEIILPDTLETIGYGAFYKCKNLEKVKLPQNLQRIDGNAFFGTALTVVTLPESIREMGSYVFSNCFALDTIYCEAASPSILWDDAWHEKCSADIYFSGVLYLGSIGDYRILIQNNEALIYEYLGEGGEVSLPAEIAGFPVTGIGANIFKKCSENLTLLVISESVTSISAHAFIYCSNLKTITIPSGVETVGDLIFFGCSSLEAIYCEAESKPEDWAEDWCGCYTADIYFAGSKASFFGIEDGFQFFCIDNVMSIVGYTGENTEITVPSKIGDYLVTEIAPYAFCDNTSIKKVVLPDSVIKIKEYAFAYCSSLEEIVLSDQLESIGDAAFAYVAIQNIVLPQSLQEIGSMVFYSTALSSITIPSAVQTMGDYVFAYCDNLETISCLTDAKPDGWSSSWSGECNATIQWQQHSHTLISYQGQAPTCSAPGWVAYQACTSCEYSTYAEIPATGHTHQTTITPPSCTEQGYTTYTCACGDSYVSDYVEPIGHAWSEWYDTTPGKEERTCGTCGETESRDKIPDYDVDGNGTVDQADVTMLMSVLVGNTETDVMFDFDFDGELTIYDCVLLMQQIG